MLRVREKIISHFSILASAHLWPMPHSQNPRNSSLFLWFCSFGSAKSEPNLSANSAKLFLREPLATGDGSYKCSSINSVFTLQSVLVRICRAVTITTAHRKPLCGLNRAKSCAFLNWTHLLFILKLWMGTD
jgi:hypothetical protein